MSSPEWMRAPCGRCLRCGAELGADPHFIVSPPDGEHLKCIDWRARPWPYARLERIIAARSRALRAATAAVADLGAYLRRARSAWPDPVIADVVRARVLALRAHLERAGARTGAVVENDRH